MEKIKCPLIGNKNISEDYCFEICMVTDGAIIPEYLPKTITDITDYKDICLECPFHHYD